MDKYFVGQKILTIYNDFIEILNIKKNDIIVRYRGKTYIIYKQVFVEKLSFLLNKNIYNLKKEIKIENDYNDYEEKIEFVKCCENCMEMKNGNCSGICGICEDFRYSPIISKSERERWPKIGAALDIKFNKCY